MKSLYPGHFKPSVADFQEMWEHSLFVFDTNVFLNLYRYSEETKKQLLSIMDEFKERSWIPHKVADEFIEKRLGVLACQIDEYDNMRQKLSDILRKLENSREHPFINSDTLEKMRDLFSTVQDELNGNKDMLEARLNNDEILQKLGELTAGRVGENFSIEELEAIYTDGAEREKNNVPPGFIDTKNKRKNENIDNYHIYGDLIIWKQILAKAKKDEVGVIFVSDDKKTDWWLEVKNRRICPLPTLFQEFFQETSQSFYMYTVDGYVERSSKYLQKKISPEVIQETKEVREFLYTIIGEQELIDKLRDYEQFITPSYVGLKIFVTSVLARQGYEINHSYAIINDLVSRGIIKKSEKPTESGTAQAISLQ